MATQDEAFNRFGEDFEGFPRCLPEDTVEYSLFIINDTLSPREILSQLEGVRKESVKLSQRLLQEYIWQRDEFQLKVEADDTTGYRYLHGTTNYGDSVEDEWLIVFLLRELSSVFSDLWIKVVDSDGQFLLIEAANALPRWLNPEIADNRVWIHSNQLRIVPLAAASVASASLEFAPLSRSLTLAEALATISKTPAILINSPLMETEAFYRLRNYPQQIASSLHYSRITIPRKLAFLIHECSASISPATEAFYLRDPISLKPLRNGRSALNFPPLDLVTISVRFTRVLFAQIRSQQLGTPSVWRRILSDLENIIEKDPERTSERARLVMGMKVTCGYEMLLSDAKNTDNRSVRKLHLLLADVADDPKLVPSDVEIAGWPDIQRDDSETWLDINFEDFEKELAGRAKGVDEGASESGAAGMGPEKMAGFGDPKTQEDLQKMVQRFETFLNDEDAGVEGVDDMDEDDDDSEDDDDKDVEDSDEEDKDISFDEAEFANMMREMMGLPPEDNAAAQAPKEPTTSGGDVRLEEISSRRGEDSNNGSDGADEAEEMRKVMTQMEAELTAAGALDLDPTPRKLAALKSRPQSRKSGSPTMQEKETADAQNVGSGRSRGKNNNGDQEDEHEETSGSNSDEDINIDYNLAKNLLESFKSQAGMAGPGGNLMSMLGMQFPRDEGDDTQLPTAGQFGKRFE